MRSKLFIVVLMATAMSVAASSALADYLDVFVAAPDQFSNPSDPTVDAAGNVTWGNDWEAITLPYNLLPPLQPGESIFLGLSNLYVNEHWVKNVTLEYEAALPVWHDQTRAGYPAGVLAAGPWNNVNHAFFPGPPPTHLVQGVIDPQPSWEWIELTNTGVIAEPLLITTYTSDCVPEPATLSLLALGGLTLVRRKR